MSKYKYYKRCDGLYRTDNKSGYHYNPYTRVWLRLQSIIKWSEYFENSYLYTSISEKDVFQKLL